MTHQILFALALSLGAAHVAAPSARACGGYGSIDPEVNAVRVTVLQHAQRRAPDGVSPHAYEVDIDGDRATAVVSFYREGTQLSEHDVRLVRRGDDWSVVRFQRRA